MHVFNEWRLVKKNIFREAKKFFFSRCQEWLYRSNLFFGWETQTPPHLNFRPANHATHIWLGSTLTLISAFQRNFSTPVSLSYGVRNLKKKNFAPPKNCGAVSKPKYSGEFHHGEFIYAIILLNLLATFLFIATSFSKIFNKNIFFLVIDPKISGG